MKLQIELTISNAGEPMLQFTHYDESRELEQKLLKDFIDKAFEKGLYLTFIGGSLTCGEPETSQERYIIIPNK